MKNSFGPPLHGDAPFAQPLKPGDRGPAVKLLQEWLAHHRFDTTIDGDFGVATESCVKALQEKNSLLVSGVVDFATQNALLAPLAAATALIPMAADTRTLAQLVVAYARQHLKQRPIELLK